MNYNCGAFNVSSKLNVDHSHDCLVLMILSVGGTGIPLLLIIGILLCALCCMCRLMRRHNRQKYSLGNNITEENGRQDTSTGGGDCSVEVELTNVKVDPPDFADRLYDSVGEMNSRRTNITATGDEEKKPKRVELQAYEDTEILVSKDLPLPVYATPDKKQKVNRDANTNQNSEVKPAVPPHPVVEQYDILHDQHNSEEGKRQSLSVLPEGMYSSIGDILPPLPSLLSPNDILEPADQQDKNTADSEDKTETVIEVDWESNDSTDQDTCLLVNQHKPLSRIADQSNRSEMNHHSSQEILSSQISPEKDPTEAFNTTEDEPEIKQDLYVNV